ncbi:MAG: tRNA (guanosine(46)-N7)-methyltransferase TrmB [Xanthomonadales bacterium]|nr:MAG: tRNA (guanosine(46)-N7)-methyltransferase TrmB [Dokdonella sp.]MBC6942239.1 tRNA (guanosine(46)-N7)-methyltransferase TrmB [Xanthomonadales bacterium]MDL1869539.1 tRNA (guanosine(46)-N7)-methyltransferase TrmB [Gammaproteobacteria bacterium PRO6]
MPATPADPTRREHRIRSFVLRQGRFTPAQQRAFEQHWARYGIACTGQARDFDALFGRHAERVLEIGFGNGEQLLHSAATEPGRDFIGVEVHRPGVGRLMNALAAAGLANVRLYNHDAVEVLAHEIAPDTLAEVRIYFPDPWHKKRHNKRRLVQADFLDLLATRVVRGGRLHLATDWADYAEHMQQVLLGARHWRASAGHGDPAVRPPWRVQTHFERRGLRLGHRTWDFVHERI